MWPALIPGLFSIIQKFLPEDPDKKSEAQSEIMTLITQHEFELAKGQAEINKVEAASTDRLVSGWRPAAGWVCVLALAFGAIIKILLPAVIIVAGSIGAVTKESIETVNLAVEHLNNIDTEIFMTLLFGLLGLGSLRTFEKIKGKA